MSTKLTYIKRQNEYLDNSNSVNESAMFDEQNATYKVNLIVDIPLSFINSYVKKVKDDASKNIRSHYGDEMIAEELVKYICKTYLNIDSIPVNAIISATATSNAQVEEGPAQAQEMEDIADVQVQDDVQSQVQAQPQVQTQTQSQPQSQPQAQVQGGGDDFESTEEIQDLPI